MSQNPRSGPRQDLEGLTAWLRLLQAKSVVVDGLERDLEREDEIPLPWVEVLMQLSSASEGRLKMQELAHSVLLSKSGVTRLVDRMAEAGLVERTSCPTDRRVVYATVTPAGLTALKDAVPVHTRGLVEHFSQHLTPAELAMLSSTLKKVLDANGFAATPCPSLLPDASESQPTPSDHARR